MNNNDINTAARQIVEEVLKRLAHSYEKYGDQFLVADIKSELDEENFDIVGWPLLLALRLKLLSDGIINEVNEEYLNKFVSRAKTPYLEKLSGKIQEELLKREV
jgi:hypothetical protein